MRRFAVATICLTLLGCANTDRFVSAQINRAPLTKNSESMRAVMGEPITSDPLTPEPGDIWADVLSSKLGPASLQQAERAPLSQAVVTNNSAPTRVAASLPAVIPLKTEVQTHTPVVTQQDDQSPGHYSVQLTAASSQMAALTQWQRLLKEVPQLIKGREPSVIMAEVDGRSLWRLRTGGFSNRADADSFCSRIRAEHSQCWVVARVS